MLDLLQDFLESKNKTFTYYNKEGEDNGKHNEEKSKSSNNREQGTADTNTKTEIIANNEQVPNVQINVMVPKEILANKNELGTSRTSNEDSRSLCARTSKKNNTEADSILFEQKKEVLEKLILKTAFSI